MDAVVNVDITLMVKVGQRFFLWSEMTSDLL